MQITPWKLRKKGKKDYYTIQQKQCTLRLLGYQADGSKGLPVTYDKTKKPYYPSSIAKELAMSRTAYNVEFLARRDHEGQVSWEWRKTLRGGDYNVIEHALQTYMLETINTMNGVSTHREDVILKLGITFRDKLVAELDVKLSDIYDQGGKKVNFWKKTRQFQSHFWLELPIPCPKETDEHKTERGYWFVGLWWHWTTEIFFTEDTVCLVTVQYLKQRWSWSLISIFSVSIG